MDYLQKFLELSYTFLAVYLNKRPEPGPIKSEPPPQPEPDAKPEPDELEDRYALYEKYKSATVDRLISTHRFLESSCSSDSDWYLTGFKAKWKGSFGCSNYESGSSRGLASSYGAKEHAAFNFLKTHIINGRIKRKDIEKYLNLNTKL